MFPAWYTPPSRHCVSGREILDRVARLHDVTVDDMTGPSRMRHICEARWAAMRELRASGKSTPRIGQLLHRDHSTVVHGLRKGSN